MPATIPRAVAWEPGRLRQGSQPKLGVPYGVIGVTMATFLGWLSGKAMLETRGFFWAWFIHVVQDVLIFSFMAAGSIRGRADRVRPALSRAPDDVCHPRR